MLTFKKILWKNFLATGAHPVEVNLNNDKTTMIKGTNGSGKSVILDSLCFGLYGKSYRKINKPQLVNSINEKDCRVEIEFSTGTTEWKVIRGIKPSIFEIYQNGKLLNQLADSLDQQKWLEQNILKMNYKSFCQIVIMGSSAFVPFMQLPAAHRREVIEDLLDIKIFSSMNVVIKERIRTLKDQIKTLESKKGSLLEKVEMQNNFITQLENKGKQDIENKTDQIQNLNREIDVFIRESATLEEGVFSLQKEIENFTNAKYKIKKLDNLKGKLTQKLYTIAQDQKFFVENKVCPTCTQEIDDTFRTEKVQELQSKITELETGCNELEEAIKEEEEQENQFLVLSKEITKANNQISQNNVRISTCQKQISQLESEIHKITHQLQNRNDEHKKLEDFKNNFEEIRNTLSEYKETIHYYDFSYGLLKDGGVKTKIIKKYLPLINQQVNRYLQMMDFYINFTLNEEFDESIQSPIHENFSYSSFSEGEKARINLALIFAWREVARLKNSVNCNIIFFDEVFDGSLDGYGTDHFLKIIRYEIKDANIFVITHKTGLEDKFDCVYNVEKIKGFSRYVKQ